MTKNFSYRQIEGNFDVYRYTLQECSDGSIAQVEVFDKYGNDTMNDENNYALQSLAIEHYYLANCVKHNAV